MAGNNIVVAASIAPQVLVSKALTTTETALYTVPASTSAKVAHGTLCNVTSLTPAPPAGPPAGPARQISGRPRSARGDSIRAGG